MDGSDEAQGLLEEIRTLRHQLGEHLATEVELPEPGPELDLKSRAGNTARIYKHIAQLGTGHALHFQYASWIKLAMLMDGFVTAVETDNSLMEYAAGRGMLELNAHTHTVMTRLKASADRVTMTNWQDLGEKFFADAVRARFGTRDEVRRDALMSVGFPRKRTEAFNIADSIERLSEVEGQGDLKQRYAVLCDFVHHNTGSMGAAHTAVEHKQIGRIGNGAIHAPGKTLFVVYADPSNRRRIRGEEFERNAGWLLRDARAATEWIGNVPQGPFSAAMNIAFTGNPYAMAIEHESAP